LYEDVVRFVEQNNAQEQIRLIGAVDDATRSVLYAHASVFTYLSLDEGFGFPILEAMAAGAPVVTSNRSCLPEIAGDAALCIAAEQPEAIQKALHAVLDDATNAQQLRTRGTQRYAEFTWKQCAEETAAVYNTLL
jgi:glycosyltransferase involved in cell wall biosynthesis